MSRHRFRCAPARPATHRPRRVVPTAVQAATPAPAPAVEEKSRPARILVVEREPAVASVLQLLLTHDGHEVIVAKDEHQALDRVRMALPDLVVLDLDTRGQTGVAICSWLKRNPATRLLPILVLAGESGEGVRLRAWEAGADGFLAKPFRMEELRLRCRSLLRAKQRVDELDTPQSVLFAFARAVEAKSPFTLGHSERVAAWALALAERLGVSAVDREVLRRGALLHDIGKISVPDCILNKEDPLTPDEFELVRQHPVQGVRIVEPLRSSRDIVSFIRWHHERLDGTGYPDGLKGSEIPFLVRILAVADVYDALTSTRPYRSAMSRAGCMGLLRANAAEGGLDPVIVRCLETMPVLFDRKPAYG